MVGTTSGAVELRGRLGSVSVTSASGTIRVAAGGGGGSAHGIRERSRSTSAPAIAAPRRRAERGLVGAVNAADIATVSGTIRIGLVADTVDVRTVSGKVELFSSGGGPIRGPHPLRLGHDPSAPGRAPGGPRIGRPMGSLQVREGRRRDSRRGINERQGRDHSSVMAAGAGGLGRSSGTIVFTDIVGFTEFTALKGDADALGPAGTAGAVLSAT